MAPIVNEMNRMVRFIFQNIVKKVLSNDVFQRRIMDKNILTPTCPRQRGSGWGW